MSLTGIPELRDSLRELSPGGWAIFVAGLAWSGLGIWLMFEATWPGQCDHEGRKIIGMIKELHCSPELLSGGAMEIGLFLWLWSLPAMLGCALLYALVRKLRTTPLSLYSDDAEK